MLDKKNVCNNPNLMLPMRNAKKGNLVVKILLMMIIVQRIIARQKKKMMVRNQEII